MKNNSHNNSLLLKQIVNLLIKALVFSIYLNCSYVYAADYISVWPISSSNITLDLYKKNDKTDTHGYSISYIGNLPIELEDSLNWQSYTEIEDCAIPMHKLKSDQEIFDRSIKDILIWDNTFEKGNRASSTDCSKLEKHLEKVNENLKNIQRTLGKTQENTLFETNEFVQTLLNIDNVIFIIGAGLSAPKVWTLLRFYKELGLNGEPGTYLATDASLEKFLHEFIKNPENHYPAISTFGTQIHSNEDTPTDAHFALKEIVEILKDKEKNIIVYSGNLDGLGEKAGIAKTDEDDVTDTSKFKSLAIIYLGLSADHAALGSRYKFAFPEAKIFSFNLEPVKILRYRATCADIKCINRYQGLFKIDGHILGDLQETIPELANQLHQAFGASADLSNSSQCQLNDAYKGR